MRTYCLVRRNHTNNIGLINTTMTNKVIKNKSKCVFSSDKSRFLKHKHNKKRVSNIIKETC